MIKQDAQALAIEKMVKHGLYDWSFKWSNAKRQFGLCQYRKKVIKLSLSLTLLNDRKRVLDTILHEIAHAILGPGYGHGRKWKQTAQSIGCNGKRCYSSNEVKTPQKSYIGTCPNCGITVQRFRRSRVACWKCCNGSFNADYLFIWTKN
ncbi:MAG: SprT-like domain-containing protein [Eubacteriales bacterium]|jgi:predicted SprT family Zn-dependent metalloprotease